MLNDSNDMALVDAIISLGRVFRCEVIAEGIETPEQGIMLMSLGCDVGQGWGIAFPMSGEEVPDWIRSYQQNAVWMKWRNTNWSSLDFPLLVAEYDHLDWVKRVASSVTGKYSGLKPVEVTDHHQCRFGLWYYSVGKEKYGHLPEFQEMEPIHRDVHRTGMEVLKSREKGEMEKANDASLKLLSLKDSILNHLATLKTAIIGLTPPDDDPSQTA